MCIVADAVAGHPILTSMAIGLFSFSWWAGNSTPQLISADAGMRLIWISVIILAFAAVEPFMSGTAASLYW